MPIIMQVGTWWLWLLDQFVLVLCRVLLWCACSGCYWGLRASKMACKHSSITMMARCESWGVGVW